MNKYGSLIKKYLSNQVLWMIPLCVFMFASTGVQLYAPQILRNVIDGIMGDNTVTQVIYWLTLFLLLVLFGEIIKALVSYTSGRIGWRATNHLRTDLLWHCLEQTEESTQKLKAGEMLEIIDGDVAVLTNFFSSLLVAVAEAILLVIGTVAAVFMENVLIGIVEIVFVVFAFLLYGKIHNISVPKWKKDREHTAKFYGYLGECIEGKEDIKANGDTEYVLEQLKILLKRWFPDNVKAGVFGMTSYAVHIFVVAISYAIIFGCGTYFWRKGAITVGTIYLLYQYNQNIISPIQRLRRQMDDLQKVTASIERMQTLLEQPVENTEGVLLQSEGGVNIMVEHLDFSYLPEKPVLKDVSFCLEKNQVLGLIGRTGSGKTTLVKLLSKMYPTIEGEIYLNELPISEIALKSIRENISYVTQEVQIFNATLRDNITFFNRNIEDGMLIELIFEMGLKEWFENLENGLDTELNQHTLSAGQAQMIALIRAFLKDASLIILDEAYANIDPLTEKYMQTAMQRLFENRTGIIIAHRLKTLEKVSHVMLLEQGKVEEYGSYSELRENSTTRLFQLLHQDASEVLA